MTQSSESIPTQQEIDSFYAPRKLSSEQFDAVQTSVNEIQESRTKAKNDAILNNFKTT